MYLYSTFHNTQSSRTNIKSYGFIYNNLVIEWYDDI